MANEKKMNYVFLGLLSHEPMTGYEIKKRMDTTLRLFWGASYGSIYPTLNMLVQEGMVTKCAGTDNGRNKIVYTITDQGRATLREWLAVPAEKDELRYETLLKLFFGSNIGTAGTLEHIRRFRDKIERELPFLYASADELEKIRDEDEAHLYYQLTAGFGIRVYEAFLKWCDEAEDILAKHH